MVLTLMLAQVCNLCLVLKKQFILLFCSNEQHTDYKSRERGNFLLTVLRKTTKNQKIGSKKHEDKI